MRVFMVACSSRAMNQPTNQSIAQLFCGAAVLLELLRRSCPAPLIVRPQSRPSMSGRSRWDGNPRRGWWAVGWEDNSTAHVGWSHDGGWWRNVEHDRRDAVDHANWWSARAEQAAAIHQLVAAEQAAVADEQAAVADSNVVHRGGTTPSVQPPDTDLNQMARETLTPICQMPDANLNQINRSEVLPDSAGARVPFRSIYTGAGEYRGRPRNETDDAGNATARRIALFGTNEVVCQQPKSALKKPVVTFLAIQDQVSDGGTGSATKGSDHRNQTEGGICMSAGSDRHNRNPTAVGNASSSTAVAAAGAAATSAPMPTRQCPLAVAALQQQFAEPGLSHQELAAIESGDLASEDLAGQHVFNLGFFQRYPTPRPRSIHNTALKYFRQEAEERRSECVTFKNSAPAKMKEMVKGEKTEFSFRGNPNIEWHWLEMVAQLDEESLAYVVEGPLLDPNRSRGLISCRLQKRRNSYDHKRHHALRQQGEAPTMDLLYEWDFVLVRENGTEVWLHPSYNSSKVSCNERCEPDVGGLLGSPQPQPDDVPLNGLGGSSGPGTYKRHKDKNKKIELRWKVPPQGKAKAKAKGMSCNGQGTAKRG